MTNRSSFPCSHAIWRYGVPALLGLVVSTGGIARAQGITFVAADSAHLTLSAFVDGYYAWDFGRPQSLDRSFAGGTLFTTQPARHNEFNVNLAFVEARLDGAHVRGRVAFQTGTSVQSNYSGEATNGTVSGPSASRLLQEAFAGVRVSDRVWVDGGIFFSHMGMEGWTSRDNPTYTRSLVAEYSPYYQTGVRVTYAATSRLTAQLDVVNGWQNISENNTGKGAGVRLDYAATPNVTLSYYNLFSDEAGNRLRMFHGIGAKTTGGRVTYLAELDAGTQRNSTVTGGSASWYGAVGIVRVQMTSAVAMSGRVERYDDKDQVIVATGNASPGVPNGALRANGASVGLDVVPQPRVLWRTELRGFNNKTAVFPDGDRAPRRGGGVVVTSLALTL